MALILRLIKGSELTFQEMDDNLVYLYNQTVLHNDLYSTVSAGAIKPGDLVPSGTTLQSFITQLLSKTYYPTQTSPYITLISNIPNLKLVGSIINITLIATFNRGSINGVLNNNVWIPTGFQNYLSGIPLSYNINGIGFNQVNINNYTVIQGSNTFNGTVTYSQGPQSYDSIGGNYGTPYSAGTLSASTTFEGVYPIFAPTSSITVSTQQPLISMNTLQVYLDIVAETGNDKQFFDIPVSWTKTLNSILYYDPSTSNYINQNQISSYNTSIVSHNIMGNDINYTRYTNTGPKHGENKIQLNFQ